MLRKRFLVQLLILAVLAALAWWVRSREQAPEYRSTPTEQNRGGEEISSSPETAGQTPKNVQEVLNYVRQHGKAPEGYVGGRAFENRERRLPLKDGQGSKIRYREWDVHPKIRGQNRGTDRLITGSNNSAYYTENHYKTFKRIE